MKLIRTFAITSKEFYDYLEQQLIEDIQNTTHRKIKLKDIKKGFSYEKKQAHSKIEILDYKRNEIYAIRVSSLTDHIDVTYQTYEDGEGLHITFEQLVDSYESTKDKKNPISKFFHEWISFGRMSNTLYDMRSAIINIRENKVQPKLQQPEPLKGLRKKLEQKYNEENK